MKSPSDAINIANVGLLLLISFCVAVIITGVLVMRSRLWQTDSGANRLIGRVMILCGAIVAFVALLFLLLNLVQL